MKRISAVFLVCVLLICLVGPPAYAENSEEIYNVTENTKIVINERAQLKTNDGCPPISEDGVILVPARKLMNAIGGSVYYNSENGAIAIVYYDSYIGLSTNNNATTIERIIDGEQSKSINLENSYIANSKKIGDEIYVPLYALGYALGLKEGIDFGYNSIEDEIYFFNASYDHSIIPVVEISDLINKQPDENGKYIFESSNNDQTSKGAMFKVFGKISNNGEGFLLSDDSGEQLIGLTDIPEVENYWKDQLGTDSPVGTDVVITSVLTKDAQGNNAISLKRAHASILPTKARNKVLEDRYKIIVNGQQLMIDDPDQFAIMFENNIYTDDYGAVVSVIPYRLYLPFRVLLENGFKASVGWHESEQIATASKDGKLYSFKIDSNEYECRDVSVENQAPIPGILSDNATPILVNGRTYLPLRAISSVFGYQTDWNEDSKTVTITTDATLIPTIAPIPGPAVEPPTSEVPAE